MPALVACADTTLAGAKEELLRQATRLRQAGVDLLWLGPPGVEGGLQPVTCVEQLAAAWEAGQTPAAVLDRGEAADAPGPRLPPWLAVELAAGEFDRVVVLARGANFEAREEAVAQRLLSAGAEAVELLPVSGLGDLSQSWISGRRTGPCRVAPAER